MAKTKPKVKKPKVTKPKTRFLPIRSKSTTLNKYEELRHPSCHNFINLRELYRYIKCEPGIFLNAAPSIFFTNKQYEEPPFDHIGMISCKPHNISFHEEFMDHIDGEKPFIATMCLQLYDETLTHIIEYHMMPFIFFCASWSSGHNNKQPEIHLLDTVNRPPEFNNALAMAINRSLDMNIKFVDVPSSIACNYDVTINLQENEIEGYCTIWTAAIIEYIAPYINTLKAAEWSEQFDIYVKLYEWLEDEPDFAKTFYNMLAMRSHCGACCNGTEGKGNGTGTL